MRMRVSGVEVKKGKSRAKGHSSDKKGTSKLSGQRPLRQFV